MAGFPSPSSDSDGNIFDEYDEFVSEHIPKLGPFLEDHDVLTDEQHVAFHEPTN